MLKIWLWRLLLLLWLCIAGVTALPGQPARAIPTLPARLRPGQEVPEGLSCSLYEPDFTRRDCQDGNDVYVVIEDRRIQHSYLLTYSSSLRVGDVMAAWGEPVWADYGGYGAVELYWPDRWLYVITRDTFSPFSRVGFIAYGAPGSTAQPWRGYRSQP